jgi:uncharacterized protein (TIGR02271 family)
MDSMSVERFQQLQGSPVYDQAGEKIGQVDEVFVDRETRLPEWIGIGSGRLRSSRSLVPVATAQVEDDAVRLPYGQEMVQSSPDVSQDEISIEIESELYAHYGLSASDALSDSLMADPSQTGTSPSADMGTDRSITRSEEELQVGTRETEAGRVRLHKWVETEPVTETVEVQYETAQVERRPVDRMADAGEIGEQDVEVTLHAEEPVVSKLTVAKEEVGLHTGTETVQQQVTEDVRKEVVEVEGDDVERID